MQKMLSLATVCTLMLLMSGCGKVKYPSYYTLSMTPELKPDVSSTPHPVTVAVRLF